MKRVRTDIGCTVEAEPYIVAHLEAFRSTWENQLGTTGSTLYALLVPLAFSPINPFVDCVKSASTAHPTLPSMLGTRI